MQFFKRLFFKRAKSRLKASVKHQLENGRTLAQIKAPRRANGQYMRKIPVRRLGKVINYIYL